MKKAGEARPEKGGSLILLLLFMLFRLFIDYPKADRYKRPLIIPRGQKKREPHTRVSTLAGALEDGNGLLGWYGAFAAYGAISRPDLGAKLASCWPWTEESKEELKTITEECKEAAGGSAGANHGTALHSFTYRINKGEKFTPLPQFETDLKAYRLLLERHGLEPLMAEQTVVVDGLPERVAGSFDALMGKVGYSGPPMITDLKSGRSLDFAWPKIAVQLALYSRATSIYDWETDTHLDFPEVNQKIGLVIHLPVGSGNAELYVVDLEAGWEAAQMTFAVRQWRKRKDLVRPAKTN